MAARPVTTIQSVSTGDVKSTELPQVFLSPIRPDIVNFVHTSMNKNNRQAYAVNKDVGHQTSAESWGTGRAVARIPRVGGGGTSRSGQGAFGNMCRGGRMFNPTKTWRKWHRKINVNQRRYAVCSALAASAVPALVMARGHKIDNVPELPLVVSSADTGVSKTQAAQKMLDAVGAMDDVAKSKASRKVRSGKGKLRNRRYVQRRGPLVVFGADESGISKSFRGLPGVEACSVERLNLLQLAPGGHMGRFIVWTEAAYDSLEKVFGSRSTASAVKKGFTLPRSMMTNSDLPGVINSDEIQAKVKAAKTSDTAPSTKRIKKNPLKNLGTMIKLNPYEQTRKKEAKAVKPTSVKRTAAEKAASRKFFKTMSA